MIEVTKVLRLLKMPFASSSTTEKRKDSIENLTSLQIPKLCSTEWASDPHADPACARVTPFCSFELLQDFL